ncbi:MAG: digeranylgeranylglycerophospholipid reductase [Haloarculaceae archaeon]
MGDHYDVVIAGAGPAGAQCARDLAARDYDVLVLETEEEAAFPRQSNKSTAGTFPSMMASFSVPDDVVMNYTDSVVLESPSNSFTREQTGAVLEFADFKRFLVRDGRDRGAEYRFDARVSKPVVEDGKAVGVRYDGDEEVTAEIIVDATGPAAPLAKDLGVSDLERERQAIGVEWEFEGITVDHPDYPDLTDAMMLRLDHDLAPGGYSWLFHTGEDTAKVGLCYIQNESHRKHATDGMVIDDYLEYWLESDPRFADAERIESKSAHRGSAHIQPPGELSAPGFMAIGDTVPTIDPLWGEGIHKGMKSARAAAVTADACLTPDEPDTSAEAMAVYDRLWRSEVAPNARTRLLMTELLYMADNDRYDRLMADLRSAEGDTLTAVNNGNKLAARKLLHLSDLSLLARVAREQFGG